MKRFFQFIILGLACSILGFSSNLQAQNNKNNTAYCKEVKGYNISNKQWALDSDGFYGQSSANKVILEDADIGVIDAWQYLDRLGNLVVNKPRIAIIDDGIYAAHEALTVSTTVDLLATVDWQAIHGTRCAGIIAANPNASGNIYCMTGVAYDRCDLIDVRMTANGVNWSKVGLSACATIASAITTAYQDHQADIILLPYNFDPCPEVSAAIEAASTNGRNGKGTIVVVSVGNHGYNRKVVFPATIEDVVAVGWHNQHNERKLEGNSCDLTDAIGPKLYCKGSNRDWAVDVVAPGSDILTTGHQHENSYPHYFQGSSAAASFTTGVLALILNVYPDATNEEAQNILKSTCDKIKDYNYYHDANKAPYHQNPNADYYQSYDVGYGKINAYNAVVKAAHLSGLSNSVALNQKIWTRTTEANQEVIESPSGTLTSQQVPLYLFGDNKTDHAIGFRLPYIALPNGAIIQKAALVFQAAETDNQPATVEIVAELGNASDYTTSIPLTGRVYSNASVLWDLPTSWMENQVYHSPDLTALVQEAVNHLDWNYSSALAFKFTNLTSNSIASKAIFSYEMAACQSPQLLIEYLEPLGGNSKTATKNQETNHSLTHLTADFQPIPFGNQLNGTIRLDPSTINQTLSIQVYNIHGQLMDKQVMRNPDTRVNLNWQTKDWAKGVYLIHLQTATAEKVVRLVKW